MTDYTELVKALRHCSHDGIVKCNECKYGGKEWPVGCEEEMLRDAADAIEELRKVNRELIEMYEDAVMKLPNQGEWIGVNPMADSVQCSVCGGQLFSAELETPYCPYCGAKMGVQDDAR